MSRSFERNFEGIGKTFQFINFPEHSLFEEEWEMVASAICGNEGLSQWLNLLNRPDCGSFEKIFVIDPMAQIYDQDQRTYLAAYDEMAKEYLGYYLLQETKVGVEEMWKTRAAGPIFGLECENVILIDSEALTTWYGSIGRLMTASILLHECTHLIETYIANGDCILGRIDQALAQRCGETLFIHPEEIQQLCPEIGPETRKYIEAAAQYQQKENNQREILTSAVEVLTAAALDLKDQSEDCGLKAAEPLLLSRLQQGLAMTEYLSYPGVSAGRRGIDVSYWNGHLTKSHYEKIKKQGIHFVIARAGGYRGSMRDSTFENNYKQAKAAGLQFGAYYYGSAVTVAQAKEEARHAIQLCRGKKLDYPIWYDVEDSTTQGKLSKKELTAVVKAFCETVKAGGHESGIYASYSWLTSKIGDLGSINVWVAQYNDTCSYKKKKRMWQYSSSKTFRDIPGHFDISLEM